MPQFRLSEAARLLGVSDDTVRRWVRAGQLTATDDAAGRKVVDGAQLDLLCVSPEDFGVALWQATGSSEHVAAVSERLAELRKDGP